MDDEPIDKGDKGDHPDARKPATSNPDTPDVTRKQTVANVTSLRARASKRRKSQAQGKTLCARGFHKWQPINDNPFDVRRGRLITGYRCARCGAHKANTS